MKYPERVKNLALGKTGGCTNERLREHAQGLMTKDGAHILTHCSACKFESRFSDTKFLGKSKSQRARDLQDAYFIKKRGHNASATRRLHFILPRYVFLFFIHVNCLKGVYLGACLA